MSDVYYPHEIQDQQLGDTYETSGDDNLGKTYSTEIYKPLTNLDKNFPSRVIAHETLSSSLDTRAKRIRGEYQFSKEGAIVVGGYVAGTSGEVAISPDGITAKNVNNETTFSIDGTTGDAVFKGTINAGALIAGAVSVGADTVSIDGANQRIVINDGTTNRIVIGEV